MRYYTNDIIKVAYAIWSRQRLIYQTVSKCYELATTTDTQQLLSYEMGIGNIWVVQIRFHLRLQREAVTLL